MIADKACYERGCACYDSRDGDGIEVIAVAPVVDAEKQFIDAWNKGKVRRVSDGAKPWVGLTDEEFKKIMLDTYNIDLNVPGHSSDDHLLWRAIEAKLKEKNT